MIKKERKKKKNHKRMDEPLQCIFLSEIRNRKCESLAFVNVVMFSINGLK